MWALVDYIPAATQAGSTLTAICSLVARQTGGQLLSSDSLCFTGKAPTVGGFLGRAATDWGSVMLYRYYYCCCCYGNHTPYT